jgi:hypothetical protein
LKEHIFQYYLTDSFPGQNKMAMKWLSWLLLAAIVSAKVRYDGHQVFRVVPENEGHLQALRDLEEQSQGVS